ncbi:MAG: hypothetical protein AAGD92_02700 [Pseudomonadota bacterium]
MRVTSLTDSILPESDFQDPARSCLDNKGPHLLIIDGFYEDPDAVRALALSKRFVRYSPPLAEQAGADMASLPLFRDAKGVWEASVLLRFRGRPVAHPFDGFRHNPASIRSQMEKITGDRVDADSWALGGDGWNGAFHRQFGGPISAAIHHHYKDGDVYPRGWSGLVYLTPDAPADAGTSIWRLRETGKCVAAKGAKFFGEDDAFELAYLVENKYNRLVLFRENVLHRVESSAAQNPPMRLTQTFFFKAACERQK